MGISMLYRENPGPYNPQDYPRSEYDGAEMARRRDSRGRFMEYDQPTHMMVGQPTHTNAMPGYYPIRPYMATGGSEYSGGRIGFAAGAKKQRMDKTSRDLGELPDYHEDYLKHQQLYEQATDPQTKQQEKQHMLMEAKELFELMGDAASGIYKQAVPEVKQLIQQMAQKMMQP